MLDFCLHLQRKTDTSGVHASTYMHVMDLAVVCVQAAPGGGTVLRRTAPYICAAQPRTCVPHSPVHVRCSTSAGWRGWHGKDFKAYTRAWLMMHAVNFYKNVNHFLESLSVLKPSKNGS